MGEGLLVVLDVGKTMSKLTLWTREGALVDRQTRQNSRCYDDGQAVLDVHGIEAWLIETLRHFSSLGRVDAIVPVGHGAGAAVIADGRLASVPSDYESPVAPELRAEYDAQRDTFEVSGSPALPDGLNLGAQLHRMEATRSGALAGNVQILTWAQYWAWFLSGVASTEISSLGCHTDLWNPIERKPSALAVRRGWARRFAPLRRAGEILGVIRQELVALTCLPHGVQIYCGLHDSNAALIAARGFSKIAHREATVLSTGTWFVAMRSPASGTVVDMSTLPVARDVLVNVDIRGQAIPSSRFMGGREIQLLTGVDSRRIDISLDQPALVAAAAAVVANGSMVLPTMAPGCGPFPSSRGQWRNMPDDPISQRATVSLYAALMAEVSLDLIGARERVLVEGRFAEAEVFVRTLAALRPDIQIFTSNEYNDVSYGALRLVLPRLAPPGTLKLIEPIDLDLSRYRAAWLLEAEALEAAV